MRKRLGKPELVAAIVIIGSAVVYWSRASAPGIVFSSPDQGQAAPSAEQAP